MSIESQIRERVSSDIGDRGITVVAHPRDDLKWPKGLGASTTSGFIIINDTYWKLDPDAGTFAVKHEIGHINNRSWEVSSSLILKILKCAAPVIGAGIVYKSSSSLPLAVIGVAVTSIFSFWFSDKGEAVVSQRKEYWADSYAIKTCTNAELKGGMRLFEAAIQARRLLNIDDHNPWTSTHPSNVSRIQRIKKELESRGEIALTSQEDKQKIIDLMCWNIYDHSSQIPEDQKSLFEEFKIRCLQDK
jgi:hypothetical protein